LKLEFLITKRFQFETAKVTFEHYEALFKVKGVGTLEPGAFAKRRIKDNLIIDDYFLMMNDSV